MTPAKSTSKAGTAAALVAQLVPVLPDNWSSLTSSERQQAMDRARHLLQVRRNLIELRSAQIEAQGLIEQLEANAAEVHERLMDAAAVLPEHRRRHLHGRLTVYHAKTDRLRAMSHQYQLEIDLYTDLLQRSRGDA